MRLEGTVHDLASPVQPTGRSLQRLDRRRLELRPDHGVENNAAVGHDGDLRLGHGLVLDGDGPEKNMLSGVTVKSRKADSDTDDLRSRLRKRTDGTGDDITDEELKELEKLHRKLRDKYRSKRGREIKERIDQSLANPASPTATPEELEEYERLRSASMRYKSQRAVIAARNKEAKAREKARALENRHTPQQLERIRQQWMEYRRQFRGKKGKKWITKLSTEERKKYNRLVGPFQEYERVRAQQRIRDQQVREYTCEEANVLDLLRPDYLQYQREFKRNPEKLAQMRRGEGTKEELDRFKDLKGKYNAYMRQTQKRYQGPEEIDIRYPASMSDEVRLLEESRPFFNMYQQFFGGSENAAKRRQLDAGIGTPEELELYRELRPKYLQHTRLYYRLRKCASTSSEPEATMKGTGRRPRWFQGRPRGPRRGIGQRPNGFHDRPGDAGDDDPSSPPPTDRTEMVVTEAPWTTTPGIVQRLQRLPGAVSSAFKRYVGLGSSAPRPGSPPAPATRSVPGLGVGR